MRGAVFLKKSFSSEIAVIFNSAKIFLTKVKGLEPIVNSIKNCSFTALAILPRYKQYKIEMNLGKT
jgi:hypothetical protein